MIRTNSQMLCYLTPAARIALEDLRAKGLDEDLALTLLEQLVPEHDLYTLDNDDGPTTP